MKKLLLFFITLALIVFSASAQNQHIIVGKNYVNPNEVTLVAERGTSTTLKFDFNELNLIEVETDYGTAYKMISGNAPIMIEEGVPELVYLPTAFVIPDVGASAFDIVYGEYTEIENVEIAPSKGSLPRSIDPATVPYVKGEVYSQNAFFPGTPATLNEPFIMRDVRGQTMFVYPVQYNPVTKVLRIYSEITITVNNTQDVGINEFTTPKRHNTIDPTFLGMYNNLFINYSSLSRGYPTGEDGELLVICYDGFMDEMKPYVDWKRTIGRKTTLVSTATTGATATAIKSYIQDYYDNPDHNLAYVLFVGDAPQIPPHNVYSTDCDNYYGQINSGNYMDILIGRMSAENVAHVQTQVERTIWYERDINTSATWITNAIGVSSNENGTGQYNSGGHDGSENDYWHIEKIRLRLLDYGYSTVYQDYYGNAPGYPNTSPTQISQRFNDGTSMANYCNHGSQTAWTPYPFNSSLYYTNSHVTALQNAGKLPFIYSVACNNGEYKNYTCFAEAWMRSTQNNQPTGAIATFMSTISLGWAPPMTAQDEFVNICMDLPTPYLPGTGQNWPNGGIPGIKRTFAGACMSSTQKMIMVHGNGSSNKNLKDYNAWTVFGDPTLQLRTKTPQEMTISHLPIIPLGTSVFIVDCDADDALAAVSYIDENDEVVILGSAVVADGVAEIVFEEPLTTSGELTLAVTGFNKVTYLATIQAGGDMVLPEPINLTISVENANHVVLTWEEPENKGLTVQGYNVYRDHVLMNIELVREELTYTDVVPQNGEYEYEVTAVYGTTLESEPSNLVKAIIDGMCVPIRNITPEQTEGANILVSWQYPEYEGLELSGYNIYRDSEQINTEIIPATELSFLDENLDVDVAYCYQVGVVYNDCSEPLKTEEKCITLLSINEFSENQKISIYPNPTTGQITINNEQLTINSIDIFDVYGKKLSHNHLITTSSHHLINISHLAAGIYFVKISTQTGEFAVQRVVLIK